MGINCVTTTNEILSLSKELNLNIKIIESQVAAWQERYNKIEQYPTSKELIKFKNLLDTEDKITESITTKSNTHSVFSIDNLSTPTYKNNLRQSFTPQIRKTRVRLLTSDFMDIVDNYIETEKTSIREGNSNKSEEDLDRKEAIKSLTPQAIFQEIKDIYSRYISEEYTDDDRLEAELDSISVDIPNRKEIAKYRVEYNKKEFKKIVDNFNALIEEVSISIRNVEGITIDNSSLDVNNSKEDSVINEEDSVNYGISEQEESIKDGWQVKDKSTSSFSLLSNKMRRILSTLYEVDREGLIYVDDLGTPTYVEVNKVHATLLDTFRTITDVNQVFSKLQELGKRKAWAYQLIERLEEDDTLLNQFYSNYFKSHNTYIALVNKNGIVNTKILTRYSGVESLLEEWKNNRLQGIVLNSNSIYTKEGKLIKDSILSNFEIIDSVVKDIESITRLGINENTLSDIDTLLSTNSSNILDLLESIGVSTSISNIEEALTDIADRSEYTNTPHSAIEFINNIRTIYNKLNKIDTSTLNSKDISFIDKEFKSILSRIANKLNTSDSSIIEGSVTERGKTQYSYSSPSYMSILLNKLKNPFSSENEYKEFIENEFMQDTFFYRDGKLLNDWVEKLYSNKNNIYRDLLEKSTVLHYNGTEYSNWTPIDVFKVHFEMFNSTVDKSQAWYATPILSDSPSADFIKFTRYNKEETIDKLVDVAIQEIIRIKRVKATDKAYKEGKISESQLIKNYDIAKSKDNKGGSVFKFLPFLNEMELNNKSILSIIESNEDLSKSELLREAISIGLDDSFNSYMNTLISEGLYTTDKGKYLYLTPDNQHEFLRSLKENIDKLDGYSSYLTDLSIEDINKLPISTLQEEANKVTEILSMKGIIPTKMPVNTDNHNNITDFFYNSYFANSQIIQILATDLALYESPEDFQKRFKQVYTPSKKGNIYANYNGERVGKENERYIVLKDEKVISNALEEINTALKQRVSKGELSKEDAESIINSLSKNNATDGQAFRTLDSTRTVDVMFGKWDDSKERAYNNFKNNIWNKNDFDVLFGVRKPFLYTQKHITQNGEQVKIGVQHKDSEFLLLAAHDLIGGVTSSSDKLRAINQFMLDNNIDVAIYESAVKVGTYGVVDLNNTKSYDEVYNRLSESIKDDLVIQTVPYESYGIQTETPEHYIDDSIAIGSQIRRLVAADISEDAIISVGNNKISKKEFLSTYNNAIIDNIIDSFNTVKEVFDNNIELSRVLQEEIKSSNQYSFELLKAVSLDENLEFTAKLFDPIHSRRVQMLLNSVIKNRVVKQKFNGGALVQVSNVGLTDELSIRFKDSKGNLVKTKSEFSSTDEYKDYLSSLGELSMAYFEAYLPYYAQDIISKLYSDMGINHNLDITKLPEDMRKIIGYRVPTEDKYSMIPIYIKDFLPRASAGTIMLPADITTIAGTDFDIDKLYILTREFSSYIDYNKLESDLLKQFKGGYRELFKAEESLRDSINRVRVGNGNSADIRVLDYLNKNIDKYTRVKIVDYDTHKDTKELNKKQRNNLLFDMMLGVLTNPDTLSKQLNPGGFNTLKSIGSNILLLENNSLSTVKSLLGKVSKDTLYDDLKTSKNLNKAVSVSNPLSPETFMYFHKQNMVGNTLIGIYANHLSNHATIQNTTLSLKKSFNIGTDYSNLPSSLSNIKSKENKFISKIIAEFLAASVDNVKDPVLSKLNQNTFTADATMTLVRAGYPLESIGLFITQPIIKELTKNFFLSRGKSSTKNELITDLYNKYYNLLSEDSKTNSILNTKDIEFMYSFENNEMANNILLSNNLGETSDNKVIQDYYTKQLITLKLFKYLLDAGDALSDVVVNTKKDSINSSPSIIAQAINKIDNTKELLSNSLSKNFPLSGIIGKDPIIKENINVDNVDSLRGNLRESRLGFPQAFYTLGLESTERLFSRHFPFYKKGFRDAVDILRSITKYNRLSDKTHESIQNDLMTYILSNNTFLNKGQKENREFIYGFPKYLVSLKSKNKSIGDLEFIKRLLILPSGNGRTKVDFIFNNKMTDSLREEFIADWESLIYMGEEAKELATNLFKYAYLRGGVGFSPTSFMHLAPLAVRELVPGYKESLTGMMDNTDNYITFVKQYILNHVDSRELLIEGDLSNNTFYKEKEILDNIEVNSSIQIPILFYKDLGNVRTYYSQEMMEILEDNTMLYSYKRVYPMGDGNKFREYLYDTEVNSIEYNTSEIVDNTEEVLPLPQTNTYESQYDINTYISTETMSNISMEDFNDFDIENATVLLGEDGKPICL